MRVAVPVFRSRVSPVFDVSRWCLVVDYADGVETDRDESPLAGKTPGERIHALKEAGVDLLICGGITELARTLAEHVGLNVFAGVAGNIDDVLRAYQRGLLDQPRFRMPGARPSHREGPRQ